MKNVKKIFGLFASFMLLAGVFTACSDSDGGNGDDSVSVEYLTEGAEVTVNSGESVTVHVQGKTNVDDFDVEGVTVEYIGDDAFEITAEDSSEDAKIILNFYDGTDDDDDGINITLYVYNPYVYVNLNIDESLESASITSIKVTYGNDTSKDYTKEAVVDYTAGNTTAVVRFAKAEADAWGFFSGIKVVVEGIEDSIAQSTTYFCYYSENVNYITEFTISKKVETSITLSLVFDGFEVEESGSVVIKYGASSATETAIVTRVSSTEYSAEISNANINASGWFVIDAVINNGDVSGFAYYSVAQEKNNTWLDYSQGNQSVKLVISNDVWVTFKDGVEYTAGSTLTKVLEPSAFTDLSVLKLKVATSGASDTTGWNPNLCYETYEDGAEWTNAKKLDWDETYENGYSLVIDDSEYINKIISNGLYLSAGAKFYVYYVAAN
ncbi:hypothetical protein DYE49_10345 [Treponema rectale]|uniref:Lipoprotein n=1 Tax=Treponema rectale TaxID=744512 RepID=A0A840SBZ3_9SPIR|nr:hypothetical protein [Treponema rectale]MBB5219287.1 hypothetical protein [Treponema rectale]QOS40828.1 hypothetical protein DYE49_10345 [Treponema rectale]